MKNRRIIFLAACMCSVVFLSGCSTDSLMDKMMGTETTVSSSASVDISKEDSDAVHVIIRKIGYFFYYAAGFHIIEI